MEKSLIMIKPDGVQNRVAGKIISRFEEAGLDIERLKMIEIDEELASKHYRDHVEKDFFKPLLKYICSGPVIVMVVSGPGAINGARQLMGPTDSKKAPGGTIRGDYGKDITTNVIHGSDSPENADREIKLFFGGDQEVM
ncbi:MAG: nucleoside-diphosphate kinase [Actinomycetia bacterium]|nr:nucleoside-diphosphate kinase [Actinomycetes bacterium]